MIALMFGGAAAVLAVATAWTTGIVKIIPQLLHGYADTHGLFVLQIPWSSLKVMNGLRPLPPCA